MTAAGSKGPPGKPAKSNKLPSDTLCPGAPPPLPMDQCSRAASRGTGPHPSAPPQGPLLCRPQALPHTRQCQICSVTRAKPVSSTMQGRRGSALHPTRLTFPIRLAVPPQQSRTSPVSSSPGSKCQRGCPSLAGRGPAACQASSSSGQAWATEGAAGARDELPAPPRGGKPLPLSAQGWLTSWLRAGGQDAPWPPPWQTSTSVSPPLRVQLEQPLQGPSWPESQSHTRPRSLQQPVGRGFPRWTWSPSLENQPSGSPGTDEGAPHLREGKGHEGEPVPPHMPELRPPKGLCHQHPAIQPRWPQRWPGCDAVGPPSLPRRHQSHALELRTTLSYEHGAEKQRWGFSFQFERSQSVMWEILLLNWFGW